MVQLLAASSVSGNSLVLEENQEDNWLTEENIPYVRSLVLVANCDSEGPHRKAQEKQFLKNDFILISCGSRCILAKLMKICSSVG